MRSGLSHSASVRASRDGDQFHYLWASRRCLKLLIPTTNLAAVSVEGASSFEGSKSHSSDPDGDEVIDIAEYYGSEDLKAATKVEYVQLKHSTRRAAKLWTHSELLDTLRGFARKFKALELQCGESTLQSSVRFRIVSNRPFPPKFLERAKREANSRKAQSLSRQIGLSGDQIDRFFNLVSTEGAQDDYMGQRQSLHKEMATLLADYGADASIRLKELVTSKALTNSTSLNVIRETDVLRALNTASDELFPAPNQIQTNVSKARSQEQEFCRKIVAAAGPVIIHAAGGVGKSILSARLGQGLPPGSVTIVYDCFGNGSYRQASRPRHRPKDGVVQIANELAGLGLCIPLIPSAHKGTEQYYRGLEARLNECAALVRDRNPAALVCLIVDAADNAEMASREAGDGASFIRTLLREHLPSGVRLVALSRTERLGILNLPSSATLLPLNNFSIEESAAHLRTVYPDASFAETDEFHRLTSQNPRVQANVLAQASSLSGVLNLLGVHAQSVDDTIASLLENAVNRLIDQVGPDERGHIEQLAVAIATLRPYIPVRVLAKVAGLDESFVRSFAADLGHPLLVSNDALQFRDEPTETWFRNRFRPSGNQLSDFALRIETLATKEAYAASALPQLLLDSGSFDHLIEIALTADALPEEPAERRHIQVTRLLFALRAALRSSNHHAAAKLALKAGQEVTGISRQAELIQNNLDLVTEFNSSDRIQEMVGRHEMSGHWPGTRHAAEAALLSAFPDTTGEARSQLRMAEAWLHNWSRLPSESRQKEDISHTLKASMAWTIFRLEGAKACVQSITRWRPRQIRFEIAKLVARCLLDARRISELEAFTVASSTHTELLLAIALENSKVGRHLSHSVLRPFVERLTRNKPEEDERSYSLDREGLVVSVIAVVESAASSRRFKPEKLAKVLDPFLGTLRGYDFSPHDRQRRAMFIRAFVLRAKLRSEAVSLMDLAPKELKAELPKDGYQQSREAREFREGVGALLPWHELWINHLTGPLSAEQVSEGITTAREKSKAIRNSAYGPYNQVKDDIAVIWFQLLCSLTVKSESLLEAFIQWMSTDGNQPYIPTWIKLSRLAAHSHHFKDQVYRFVSDARSMISGISEDATSQAASYVDFARALLAVDKGEAKLLYENAIAIASRLGDEVGSRWMALLDLADCAANPNGSEHQLAYRLARCAELAHQYNEKHFDWDGTMCAINGLSPTSGIAIVSRWRDRRVGPSDYLLAKTFTDLLKRRGLQPLIVPSLIAFHADWNHSELLKHALKAASPNSRQNLLSHTVRLMRLQRHAASTWECLADLVRYYGIAEPAINEQLEYERAAEAKQTPSAYDHTALKEREQAAHAHGDAVWKRFTLSGDLYTHESLLRAHRSWRSMSDTRKIFLSDMDFIHRAFNAVDPTRAVEFIQAFALCTSFDAWDVKEFFTCVPAHWKTRLAIQAALRDAARSLVQRFCGDITNSRRFQPLPLKTLADTASISQADLIQITLEAVSGLEQLDDADRLFSLLGLLTPTLSRDEAADALDYGLGIMEAQADDSIGDGAWSGELRPPAGIDQAIAGFFYAQLASPKATVRWEAAHAVHELSKAGLTTIFNELVRNVQNAIHGPFVDSRLMFYEMHARLWFFIALSRCAVERPEHVTAYLPYCKQQATSQKHVLIRHFAREVCLACAYDQDEANTPEVDLLRHINNTALPIVISKRYERTRLGEVFARHEGGFLFGYDLDKYWFQPLASCFGITKERVMSLASDLIQNTWQATTTGAWKDDERVARGIFRERETWYSHGTAPTTDNVNFYLSFHALMVTAGDLLADLPLHKDEDEDVPEFDQWLKGHLLTRNDGYWLADTRSPEPANIAAISRSSEANWIWTLGKPDFLRCLGSADSRFNLWARWTTVYEGRGEEHVSVTSALVDQTRSRALARAMQSTDNPHAMSLPSVGDEDEIDQPPFRLSAWVNTDTLTKGLDETDPWAGSIYYPSPRPSDDVCKRFGLVADPSQQRWELHSSRGPAEVMWSRSWGEKHAHEDEEGPIGSGTQLQVSPHFLKTMLTHVGMDVIVYVLISREIRKSRYESAEATQYVPIPPYAKAFLFTADGILAEF